MEIQTPHFGKEVREDQEALKTKLRTFITIISFHQHSNNLKKNETEVGHLE